MYESIMKNTYNANKQLCLYYTYKRLWQGYLGPNLTDTALKVSRPLYSFTTSLSHGIENYFLGLWGMGTSDAIF